MVLTPSVAKKLAKKGSPSLVKSGGGPDSLTRQLLDLGDNKSQLLSSGGLNIKIRGVISTQAPGLDAAIGRGGIPLGRLTILHGGEGSGKTTLALHIVAECQRVGGKCIYIDNEYKMDPEYAEALGVDLSSLIYHQPNHLEEAFEYQSKIIELLASRAAKKSDEERARDKRPYLIVLDSMNASITKAELEGEWEDQHMAPAARVYSRLLPKLMPLASRANVALLWISQVRKKMNITYGDDNEVAGGNAPKFYASLILDVKRLSKVKSGDDVVGNDVRVTCKKNQIAMPFRVAELEISYGRGINKEASLISLAESYKLIKSTSGNYALGDLQLGKGLPRACRNLIKDPTLKDKIYEAIEARKVLMASKGSAVVAEEAEAAAAAAPEADSAKPMKKKKAKLAVVAEE